jgi:two-component system response regulator CpxR
VSTDALSLLLVDDDEELCALMREFLARREIELETVHDGRLGLTRAVGGGHDLVLLDVMLPGIDGFEVLYQIRRQSNVPVILLTARTAQVDRVKGLDAGADDYLPKPFGPEELLARIRAVLRRSGQVRAAFPTLDVGGLRLTPGTRAVEVAGAEVEVTTLEYDILEYLVRAAGRVVRRDELSSAVQQRKPTPFDRSLDVHISHLRRKLGSVGDSIRTVRGIGYLFQPLSDGVRP